MLISGVLNTCSVPLSLRPSLLSSCLVVSKPFQALGTVAPLRPSVHEMCTRQEYWVLPFPFLQGLSHPGSNPCLLHISGIAGGSYNWSHRGSCHWALHKELQSLWCWRKGCFGLRFLPFAIGAAALYCILVIFSAGCCWVLGCFSV